LNERATTARAGGHVVRTDARRTPERKGTTVGWPWWWRNSTRCFI